MRREEEEKEEKKIENKTSEKRVKIVKKKILNKLSTPPPNGIEKSILQSCKKLTTPLVTRGKRVRVIKFFYLNSCILR